MKPYREQAREVAESAWDEYEAPAPVADAVSDIWEPLVRDLLEAHAHWAAMLPLPDRLKGIYTRTKHALGEAP